MNALVFSPDGTRLATAGDDRSARVFDAATGEQLVRLEHDGPVRDVAFSPDGAQVATCGMEGAGTYAVVPAQLLRQAFRAMSRPLNGAELRRYSLSSHCGHVTRWNSEHPPFAGNQ